MPRRDIDVRPSSAGQSVQSGGSPRVGGGVSVGIDARDRRGAAVVLTGAIGGCSRLEPAAALQRRSPGELGPAQAKRAKPRAARRPIAIRADADEEAASSDEVGAGSSRRRERAQEAAALPGSGLSGLPGLGVYLGELGSPAKPGAPPQKDGGAKPGFLGAHFRAIPGLVDVSVSIGGDPARGGVMRRLLSPLRARPARRSPADAGSGRVAPPPATGMPTKPATSAAAPAPIPTALAPDPALDPERSKRGGRLRRASRYLVNGILDIAIRRFRAPPR